ncbi:kinesin-like protein KIF27 isoform X2 [Eriocheir sinensis]|uniref:kinesin-like protein KIF27 isoform X2 n=1 Tax=Eriocheir sinensis TaxID=95602 RepID=UPI0021C9AA04|nr:kinesin-like protein KIF27 isoform X2 [Eriocheir sinensis]
MEVPIRVVSRVRPCNAQEQSQGTCVEAAPASSQVILGYDHFCDFDAVFGPDVTQKELYSACLADLVLSFFQGYNVTVLGYGQRGSGKTYTLTGPDFLWAMNEEEFGLLPQAVRHIFNLMRECPGREYRIHVSYLVVQRDAVYDLLSATNSYLQLNVLEDNMGNVVIPGLNVIDCSNITEVINCLEAGLVHRHTAALHSHDPAASHAIFSLILEHQWSDADGKMKYLYSRMNFVDLGGSERLMQFGYGDFGLPSEDSFFLNSDLKALSNVIHYLADHSYTGPVPYKESRLTHILKDAFGGNSLCLMVCCLSPSPEDFDATFHTLKYGGMARYILNCPAVNMAIQNSAPASSSATTLTPSSLHTTLRQQSTSRQSTLTGLQSSVHHSTGTVHQSTATSATSGPTTEDPPPPPPSEPEDMFKFQFAASQWQQLVSSAEDLLSGILQGAQVTAGEKTRIEAWMCMKAEAEECIGVDLGTLRFNSSTNRVLEVIEELSEPEITGTVSPPISSTEGGTEDDRSASSSTISSLGEEFYDQLALLSNKFTSITEQLVEGVQDSCDTQANVRRSAERRRRHQGDREKENEEERETDEEEREEMERRKNVRLPMKKKEEEEEEEEKKLKAILKTPKLVKKAPLSARLHRGLQGAPRRTNISSISPHRSIPTPPSSAPPLKIDERRCLSAAEKKMCILSLLDECGDGGDGGDSDSGGDSGGGESSGKESDEDSSMSRRKSSLSFSSQILESPKKMQKEGVGEESVSLVEEMKRLSASRESRRGQVRRASMELRAAQQRLKQLNATIRLKEAFIRELVRSGGEAEVTRKKCEAKMSRLEKEVERARQLHQETQHQLKELREGESPDVSQFRGRVDSLKRQITHYQKKLATLGKVADISQQGDTKVTELEGSVREMRRQQGELQTRLQEETQKKEELEQQITLDQRRIKELEIRLKQGEGEVEGERGWLLEEEERILSLREATEQLQQEVERREEAVKKRERMQKEKVRLETSRRAGLNEEEVEEEEGAEGGDGGERRESDIREEISHLRDARDSLMMHRQKLDRRIHKSGGRRVGSGEERRLLELDEAIEAVDAAIEYKNEVICGRAKELQSHALLLNQDHLMERLVNLSHEETRSLLVKYFSKVIDLRVEFRKQDIAFNDLENQYDEQSRYISDLKAAYQQASLEVERRITMQQRDYQQKIATLLRQFNDDSSGSGAQEFRLREMEKQVFYYKKLSRDLKSKLRQTSGEDGRKERMLLRGGGGGGAGGGGVEDTPNPTQPDYHHSHHHPQPKTDTTPHHHPHHHTSSYHHTHHRPLLPTQHPSAPLLPRRTRIQAAEQAAHHPVPHTRVTREKNKIIIHQKSSATADRQAKSKSGLETR